eukprot:TRINITY_DN12201_c0_g1_i25.p2 TRINITY_DN12201_c0_g1~~TRINITY_DN12201_c0_g1_i25.p2  ORF type:complete len:100 (-),score=9.38 TRINITY_DN12201_c0_g1_i25:11-310(-)
MKNAEIENRILIGLRIAVLWDPKAQNFADVLHERYLALATVSEELSTRIGAKGLSEQLPSQIVPAKTIPHLEETGQKSPEIGRAVQQECRDRSRMPSSA